MRRRRRQGGAGLRSPVHAEEAVDSMATATDDAGPAPQEEGRHLGGEGPGRRAGPSPSTHTLLCSFISPPHLNPTPTFLASTVIPLTAPFGSSLHPLASTSADCTTKSCLAPPPKHLHAYRSTSPPSFPPKVSPWRAKSRRHLRESANSRLTLRCIR